jgi:hypothetical protein
MPLGMSYPAIVHDVGLMLQREPLRGVAELVIDETGVAEPLATFSSNPDLSRCE